MGPLKEYPATPAAGFDAYTARLWGCWWVRLWVGVMIALVGLASRVCAQTDTTPPSIPAGLAATEVTVNSFSLSWSASTDNVGVTAYEVFRGSTSLGLVPTPALSLNIGGLAPNTAYAMKVRARDGAGKWSALSLALSVKTLADTTAPAVPSGLVASLITATSFTVSWPATTDNVAVTGYEVFKNGVSLGTTTALTKAITALLPTTAYAITVRARDAAGNWSAQSSALSVTTLPDTTAPAIPAGVNASLLTATTFTLKWSAATDNVRVTGYEVFRDGTSLGVTTATSKAMTGLSPTTAYAFTVRARDAAANGSGQTTPLSVTTLPDTTVPTTPASLTPTTVTISSFIFRWSASTDNVGVTGYEVFRDGVSLGLVAAPATSLSVSGLALSTPCVMTVRARDAAGNYSSLSAARTVTTLADTTAPTVPNGLAASAATINSFTLSWNASTDNVGVTAYEVFRGTVSLGLVTAPSTSLALTGLAPNTGYSMRVRARDAAGKWSAQSVALVVRALPDTTDPVIPSGLAASAVTVTGFTLSWPATTDDVAVNGYEVFRNGVSLGTTTALSRAIAGLTPNTSYSFTVRARDAAANWSEPSAPLAVMTLPDTTAPTVPVGLNATVVSVSTFTLKWTAATDDVRVTGYEVSRDGVVVGTASGPSRNITGLVPETSYTFTVRARDAAGNWSAPSAPLAVTTLADTTPPAIPTGLVASLVTGSSFTLRWTAPKDNVRTSLYEVFRDGVSLGTTTATSRNLTGLFPETEYAMTVRASDAAGNWSDQSLPLPVTTLADTVAPSTPASLVASAITVNSFTLSWTASTDGVGVTLYEIFQDNVAVGSTASTTFGLTGLTPNTTYLLTVRASDSAGNWSAPSTAKSVKTAVDNVAPTVPTGLVADAITGTTVTLIWNPSTDNVGVTAYEVFRGTISQGTTDATSMVINGLTLGTTYSLKVRARDAKGNWSAQSAALSVTTYNDTTAPTVPGGLAATAVTLNSLTLVWNSSTDDVAVTAYEVYRDGTSLGTTTTPTFNLTGLAPNTSYVMTVRARDAAGNWSALSAPVAVSPAPDTFAPSAPGAVTTTNLTPTGFTVNWSAAVDDVAVTGYEVFVNGLSQGTAAANATSFNVTTLPAGGPPYVVTVHARDAAGNWSTASEPLSVTLNPLPFFTGFETTDSYTLGSLHGQNGWSVDGAAAVVTAPAYRGTQAIAVAPMANLSLVTRQFANANPGVTFVDVFARPAASDNPDAGTFIETDEAAVALIGLAGTDSVGAIQVFDGDGSQGGSWTSAGTGPALEVSTGQVTAWQRLTIRTDYVAKRWDLFLNGRLIAANLSFLDNTATRFTSLSLNGHATLATGFDDVFVGFDNPLFTDADKDGMDDTWETANGLNPAVNDRDSDLDGDGISNLFEHLNGTGANIPNTPTDTDGDGLLDAWERQYFGDLRYSGTADPGGIGRTLLQLQAEGSSPWPEAPFSFGLRGWYRADLGAAANASGKVSQWTDLSGNGNHGAQTEPLYWPASVAAQMNGRPVLRFNGANNYFNLPDMMAGATSGEIFVVARLKDFSNNYSGLVHFGTGYGTIYSVGGVWNDFGTNDEAYYARPTDAVVTQAHLANASVSIAGESALRINGVEHVRLDGKSVGFRADPAIGIDRYGEAFNGDIAEVMVFNRVLSDEEREQINLYIGQRYGISDLIPDISSPSAPTNLSAASIGARSLTLNWTPSTDDRAVVKYRVLVGGAELGQTAASSFPLTGLKPETRYAVTVVAEDAAGNASPESSTLTVTTIESVSAPANLSATGITPTGFTLSWSASRGSVVAYDIFRDGVLVGSTTALTFSVSGLPALNSFTLSVTARDAAGFFVSTPVPLRVPDASNLEISNANDGIPDRWKLAHGFDPAAAGTGADDTDGDGKSNLVEFLANTDPNDYYEGRSPVIVMLTPPGELGPNDSLSLKVTDTTGAPMVNAPVEMTARDGQRLVFDGAYPSAKSVTVRTNAQGIVTVYVETPDN